jgi:hypothetical protein
MVRKTLMAAALIAAGTLTTPVMAQELVDWPMLNKMTDKNGDKMVSKQEFLDAMAMAYDKAMVSMKKKPNMVKDDKLTMDAYKQLIKELYSGA